VSLRASYAAAVSLDEDIRGAAGTAAAFAGEDERVVAVLAAEPADGIRVYICSFERHGERAWLVLDGNGEPVTSRSLVREAVSLVALSEIAEEAAGIEVELPRLATPAYLDDVGTPDVAASLQTVDALLQEVEAAYKQELR
jgi:hypothetical protein